MSLVLLILLAPFVYWVIGAGLLVWRDDDALDLALLLGGAVAGLCCEFSYTIKVRPELVLIPLIVASLASLVVRFQNGRLVSSLTQSFILYVIALLPVAASPFPILGIWGGDWHLLLNSGLELFEGKPMTAGTLQRPPLFGASVAPLWMVADGLIPFQLFAAVMSGGVLSASFYVVRKLWPHTAAFRAVAPLAISPFFLHNTAACWGKLMAAGLLLAAMVEALQATNRRSFWWAAVWFALSVAVHQSSIIYVPLVAMCVLVANRGQVVETLLALVPFIVCGILIVGLFEGWTIFEYGLDAKIRANPAVAQRDPNVTFVVKTFLAIVASLVAWAPIESAWRWFRQPDAISGSRISTEGYWLITSWLQTMAGSFLGAFWPLLVAGGRKMLEAMRGLVKTRIDAGFALCVIVAIVLNGLLSPYYSSSGCMQNGLAALALIGFLAMGNWIAVGAPKRWNAVVILTALFGTIPWFVLNLGVTIGIAVSNRFRSALASGSENDWERLIENHLDSLGMIGFPYLQLTLLFVVFGATIVAIYVHRPITFAKPKEAAV